MTVGDFPLPARGLARLGGVLPLDLSRKWWLPFGPWPVTDALSGVLVGGEVAGRYARTLLGV